MKLRSLIPAVVLIPVLLLGCAPDPIAPAQDSSPSSPPTDDVAPSQTESTNNPFDY